MSDNEDQGRLFDAAPLLVGCCPALHPEAAAALSAEDAVLVAIELALGNSAGRLPGCDVLLVSSRTASEPEELAGVARAMALVLHLESGDGVDGSLGLKEIWRRAIAAGIQDVMTSAELCAPGAALRLGAAAMRHRLTQLARSAYATDLSTGLPHRQQLLEHMTQLLALRRREPAPMGLLVFRLGTPGPPAARLDVEDAAALRRKVAVRLRSGLRASDVVASLEEEEFAVLLTSVDAPADIERVMVKLTMLAHRPLSIGGQALKVELYPGVARYPEDGDDATFLLQHAQRQARSSASALRRGDARDTAANDPAH